MITEDTKDIINYNTTSSQRIRRKIDSIKKTSTHLSKKPNKDRKNAVSTQGEETDGHNSQETGKCWCNRFCNRGMVKKILEFRVFFTLLKIVEMEVAYNVLKWLSEIHANRERIWLKPLKDQKRMNPLTF